MNQGSMAKKRKRMFALARKKAEKEASLYIETCRFVFHYYCTTSEEERKVLDVVKFNLIDIYDNYYNKVLYPPKVNFNEDDVSAFIKEYRSKVEKELNYFFEKMINVATKQEIKEFIVDYKQGDISKHAHIWDGSCQKDRARDYDIFTNNRTGNGHRKKKMRKKKSKAKAPKLTQLELQQQKDAQEKEDIVKQEANHYLEMIMSLENLAQGTTPECLSLHRAYSNVLDVFTDWYFTYSTKEDESGCHRNVSLMIKENRLKVEEELNYVCNKISNATIKEAYSRLLADFQTWPMPKEPHSQIHHPHIGDKDGNLMSSKPNMISGEGSSKPLPICDDKLYNHDHDKCCRTPLGYEPPEPIFEVIVQRHAESPDPTFADVESEDYEW